MAKGDIKQNYPPPNSDPLWAADYYKVQQFLNGKESAWEELYRQTYPLAVKMAQKSNSLGILRDADMQDIVSESFQRCLSRIGTFKNISRFSTWVCGFVRYVSLETIRRKCNQWQKLHRYYEASLVNAWYPDPESWLLKKERDTCLWIAFYSLSAQHQALISCFVLNWNSVREARVITGLRSADMKSELTLAISILRKRFIAAYYI